MADTTWCQWVIRLDAHELQKLTKIIGMIGSAHEGEALVALRMAMGILKRHGLTLQQVIERGLQPERQQAETREDVYASAARTREQEAARHWSKGKPTYGKPRFKVWDGIKAEHMLAALRKMSHTMTSWDMDMLKSFEDQHKSYKGLTEKQWGVMLIWAERARIYRPPAA